LVSARIKTAAGCGIFSCGDQTCPDAANPVVFELAGVCED
jgi:hypothetical protein